MGSNFIKYILEKYPSYSVVNLDKLTYAGNLDNLKGINGEKRHTFIKGDIAEPGDVEKACREGIDTIINYAAETHVDRSILDPEAFIRTDIMGTYRLLEAVRKGLAGRLIQISTDEVFGMVHSMEEEFTEDSKFDPSSPYSASKAGGDHLCQAYHKTYRTPVIVTHSCNFYGPNQYPEKIIPLFITNLLEGGKIPLYGKGDQFREWIFTQDHCSAIDAIMHKGQDGEVYNIGTRQRLTNRELTGKILALLQADVSRIEAKSDRPGHDFGYAVNPDKLMAKLGWRPAVSLDKGLEQTVAWYKNNREWWKKIKSGEYLEYYKKQYKNTNDNPAKA